MEFLEIKGWELNPNEKVRTAISNRLLLIETATGKPYCPCQFKQEEDLKESIICPCTDYRAGNGCHCHLYLKKTTE